MPTVQIEYISPHKLQANPRNARTHSEKQIFTNPILTDAQTNVLAGHARLAAGKLLGLESVPCIRLTRS